MDLGRQFQLFDPGPATSKAPEASPASPSPYSMRYDDDHAGEVQPGWEPSRLPPPPGERVRETMPGKAGQSWDSYPDYENMESDVAFDPKTKVEQDWVPMEGLTSSQRHVDPGAVEHMVEHANPMALDDDPLVVKWKHEGQTQHSVMDGNHRANAALRRGQLFMPAHVYTPSNFNDRRSDA